MYGSVLPFPELNLYILIELHSKRMTGVATLIG